MNSERHISQLKIKRQELTGKLQERGEELEHTRGLLEDALGGKDALQLCDEMSQKVVAQLEETRKICEASASWAEYHWLYLSADLAEPKESLVK